MGRKDLSTRKLQDRALDRTLSAFWGAFVLLYVKELLLT